MAHSPDIFSAWEEGIWAIIESDPRLVSLVRLRNRIKMVDSAQPFKPDPSSADVPELMLVPTTGQRDEASTGSSSYGFIQRYTLVISTDQARTNQDRSVYAVMSAIFSAFYAASVLPSPMPGSPEVKYLLPGDWTFQYGQRGTEADAAKVEGWQASFNLELRGVVPRSFFNT